MLLGWPGRALGQLARVAGGPQRPRQQRQERCDPRAAAAGDPGEGFSESLRSTRKTNKLEPSFLLSQEDAVVAQLKVGVIC